MDVHHTKDGLETAQRIAQEFIRGLGVDPDGLKYRRLGTPAELLNRHQPDLQFTGGFPSRETCYHEAQLNGSHGRTIIDYEISDRLYPIMFRNGNEDIDYELLQRCHTTELHRQVLAGMEVYGSLFGRNVSQESIFLSTFHKMTSSLLRFEYYSLYPIFYRTSILHTPNLIFIP